MATAGRKTDDVLASARKELQGQLEVVRGELARLAREEQSLTQALHGMNGGSSRTNGADAQPTRSRAAAGRRSTRKPSSGRRQRRGASKSTADRVEELRGLLVEGPKSRNDLAAALKVSPARVQQLLGELGGSVSSQPDPQSGRSKLWALKGSGNGGGAAKSAGGRTTSRGTTRSGRTKSKT